MQSQFAPAVIASSALTMGCARLGSALTPLSRRECVALIEEAFALGVRHFDTASIYGQGDSERFLGEALQRHRDRVCLSSKAGQRLTRRQALMARFKPAIRWLAAHRSGLRDRVGVQRAKGLPRCFDPDAIEQSLLASLQRLRTDHLDVFYLHSPDAAVLDDAVLMARIERLRERGLFRAFGVSCDDATLAWKAAAHEAVQVVQFDVNEVPDSAVLLQRLEHRGKRAVLRGFMFDSGSEGLAARFEAALRWPAVGGLIVGTTRVQHLRDNVSAFERAVNAREPR